MPSHYSNICFPIENADEYRRVAEHAAHSGKIIPVTGGALLLGRHATDQGG